MKALGKPYVCSQCQRNLQKRQTSFSRTIRRYASATTQPVTRGKAPLRVGVIGSGPAGFYAAARILQKSDDARVDMYEKLPVPFGLVRYGVAPDHPEVKNCEDRFKEVATSKRFSFIGNAEVGSSIPLASLRNHYDAILFAYGAAKDKPLGVPGEDLDGVYSARAFVGWYNGLPEYRDFQPNLQSDTAVVIGHGNVALDVARILLSHPNDLKRTDISQQALELLSASQVKKVIVAGRRGPMQAAFTIKEVRELMQLRRTRFLNSNPELIPKTEQITKLSRLEQRKYRLARMLEQDMAPLKTGSQYWSLWSLVSPILFEPEPGTSFLARVVFRCNDYADPNTKFEKHAQVVSSRETVAVDTRLAFKSIGYQAISLPGLMEDLHVAFDERKGTITNDGLGRAHSTNGNIVHGCYCAGWVKNGPTGVIATTMEDAFASADSILEDWETGKTLLNGTSQSRSNEYAHGWHDLSKEVGLSQPVSWDQWQRIDSMEISRGRLSDKPREKLTSIPEMLEVASTV